MIWLLGALRNHPLYIYRLKTASTLSFFFIQCSQCKTRAFIRKFTFVTPAVSCLWSLSRNCARRGCSRRGTNELIEAVAVEVKPDVTLFRNGAKSVSTSRVEVPICPWISIVPRVRCTSPNTSGQFLFVDIIVHNEWSGSCHQACLTNDLARWFLTQETAQS